MRAREACPYELFHPLEFLTFLPHRRPRPTHVTPGGVSTHHYLLGLPVSLWVVLLEPGEPKDDVLLPQAGHCKRGAFHVPILVENCIYNFCDGSCLIRASIHIKYWDGTSEFPCGQPVLLYMVTVYELASGSTVYKCRPRLDPCSISCLNFHFDDQGLRTRGSCHHILFWKVPFLSAEAEQMRCQS